MKQQKQGIAIVELVMGFLILVFIVFLFLDLYLLLQGAGINEAVDTDATKAASSGPPGKLAAGKDRIVSEDQPPYKRAYAVVDYRRENLSQPYELADTIEVKETVQPPIPAKPFGGPVSGSVTVTTTILIHPRFILNLLQINTIALSASKTFPYSWIMQSEMFPKTSCSSASSALMSRL